MLPPRELLLSARRAERESWEVCWWLREPWPWTQGRWNTPRGLGFSASAALLRCRSRAAHYPISPEVEKQAPPHGCN